LILRLKIQEIFAGTVQSSFLLNDSTRLEREEMELKARWEMRLHLRLLPGPEPEKKAKQETGK